jgi:hypothetical protein
VSDEDPTEAPDLVRAARERASRGRDGRIGDVLAGARVLVREREGWEASDGRVRAFDATLLVDAATLATCTASPALRDAVTEALSAAAPEILGGSLADLAIALDERIPERTGPYRRAS